MSSEAVGGSKFESALGPPMPARVFRVGLQGGADILFLDGGLEIRVCGAPGAPGRTVYTVSVNGQRASTNDAGQYVAFLLSAQYFVMAWDEPTSTALQRALGVAPARC